MSLVVKTYEHFIEGLYHDYAGKSQKNQSSKVQKKMLLNQFKSIFVDASIRKTMEALKDAEISFI